MAGEGTMKSCRGDGGVEGTKACETTILTVQLLYLVKQQDREGRVSGVLRDGKTVVRSYSPLIC